VNPVVLENYPLQPGDRYRFVGQLFDGPLLITEHLDNGSLQRLIDRSKKVDYDIPNRILWRIFLCREQTRV
jgi:hypothetical protein